MTVINEIDFPYLTGAVWTAREGGDYLSGKATAARIQDLVLSGNIMPHQQFEQLSALNGQFVVVYVCGHDSDSMSYYSGQIRSIAADQVGENPTNIRVELKVLT